MTYALGGWTCDYDGYGRLVKETYPDKKTILRAYDDGGNLTMLTDPSGLVRTMTYDAANRMTAIADGKGRTIALAYDYAGNVVHIAYGNGTVKTVAVDDANQVTEIAYRLASDILLKLEYEYDSVGNRIKQQEGTLEKEYSYDASSQLTREYWHGGSSSLDVSLAYDEVGNRTQRTVSGGASTTYTCNAANELVATVTGTATTTMAYDAQGNLVEQVCGEDHWWYTYSDNGKMIAVKHRYLDDEGHEVIKSGMYRYDGLGRRIYRRDLNGQGTWCYYDGLELLAEKDEHGRFRASYIYGPGLVPGTGLLLSSYTGAAYRCYHQDALGTTRLITDVNGKVIQSYQTDAWGNIIASTGTTRNTIIFTGRQFDADIGLYYYLARNYMPRIGSFNSKDPLETIEVINPYKYVHNNPTMYIDPWGLASECCHNVGAKGSVKCDDPDCWGYFGCCANGKGLATYSECVRRCLETYFVLPAKGSLPHVSYGLGIASGIIRRYAVITGPGFIIISNAGRYVLAGLLKGLGFAALVYNSGASIGCLVGCRIDVCSY